MPGKKPCNVHAPHARGPVPIANAIARGETALAWRQVMDRLSQADAGDLAYRCVSEHQWSHCQQGFEARPLPPQHRDHKTRGHAVFPESFTHWLISTARGPTKNQGLLQRPSFATPSRSGPSRPHRPAARPGRAAPHVKLAGPALRRGLGSSAAGPRRAGSENHGPSPAPVLRISGNTGLHVYGPTEAQVFGVLYHRKTANPYHWISALTGIRATWDLRACAGHPAQDPLPRPQTLPP